MAAQSKKQPGIFIKNVVCRDAHSPQGNPEGFKSNVGALIDAGNIVAVGENGIEREFDTSKAFGDWFDGLKAA